MPFPVTLRATEVSKAAAGLSEVDDKDEEEEEAIVIKYRYVN